MRNAARKFLRQDNQDATKFEVFPLLLPLSAMAAPVSHPLLAVIYAFVLIPLIDMWTGDDKSAAHPGKLSVETKVRIRIAHRRSMWALSHSLTRALHSFAKAHFRDLLKYYVFVHYAMLLTVMHAVCTSMTLSTLAIVGIVLSLGVGASMSFTVAHELVHSTDDTDRALSAALLLPNFYMHWGRAHLQHHAHVGTQKDPTTSRKGETVYAFWVRSIVGNIVNAYAAEWKRPNGGRVITWILAPCALLLATFAAYGRSGAAVLLGQALVSVIMLETVNYIEHYGLVRESKGAVLPKHSWNSSTSYGANFDLATTESLHCPVSLALLASRFDRQETPSRSTSSGTRITTRAPRNRACMMLTIDTFRPPLTCLRVSALRNDRYYLLESIEDAPQLPAGYPAMMLLSLVPSMWFSTMDDRLDEWNGANRE